MPRSSLTASRLTPLLVCCRALAVVARHGSDLAVACPPKLLGITGRRDAHLISRHGVLSQMHRALLVFNHAGFRAPSPTFHGRRPPLCTSSCVGAGRRAPARSSPECATLAPSSTCPGSKSPVLRPIAVVAQPPVVSVLALLPRVAVVSDLGQVVPPSALASLDTAPGPLRRPSSRHDAQRRSLGALHNAQTGEPSSFMRTS